MTRVAFHLAFKTQELNALSLPIEVRRPNATLVGRVVAGEDIELPVGDYYAVARMPRGQRLIASFSVGSDSAPMQVPLAPDPEDESPHEWEEVRHFLGAQAALAAPPPPPMPAPPPVAPGPAVRSGLRRRSAPPADAAPDPGLSADTPPPRPVRPAPFVQVFRGNIVQRTHLQVPASQVLRFMGEESNRVVQWEVAGGDAPLIAQLVQPHGRVQNLALPVSSMTRARLVASRDASGDIRLEAYLQGSASNMLLQYTGAGLSTTAARATQAMAESAEQLLARKDADPVGAAVGAYAILRVGAIEQLHDWTSNLRAWFPWLPDGAAICGEHLARQGRFEDAFDAFLEVPTRGLPLFSDGLFYTVERLKLYCRERIKTRGRIDPSRSQAAFELLQPFASALRRQRPISTWPGLDVAKPNGDDAPVAAANAMALDLTPWFPSGG
jgi:hypothetical protein